MTEEPKSYNDRKIKQVSLRMPTELMQALDRRAFGKNVSRTRYLTLLLERDLNVVARSRNPLD